MGQLLPEVVNIVWEINIVYHSVAFQGIFDTFSFTVTFTFAVICLYESHSFAQ